jgi:hypothetical protein
LIFYFCCGNNFDNACHAIFNVCKVKKGKLLRVVEAITSHLFLVDFRRLGQECFEEKLNGKTRERGRGAIIRMFFGSLCKVRRGSGL